MRGAYIMADMRTISISVRTLVEFILRSGDILPSSGRLADAEAMQAGSRLHRKIQRRAGSSYLAEVPLSITVPVTRNEESADNISGDLPPGITFNICLTGRADGIILPGHENTDPDSGGGLVIIDEIKGVYRDIHLMAEPSAVHLAQAKCYGYIYAKENGLKEIGIRMTYGNLESEELRYFDSVCTFEELEGWFMNLIHEYSKWAAWQIRHEALRTASIQDVEFPFPYRPGQKELVRGVYLSLIRKKRLFIEAPTGVGKTMSTLYPTVKAMGEGHVEKIFYLTAKTITRTVAQEAFSILSEKGVRLHYVTITAKDKICIYDKAQCDPALCPRARGHFDRINDAVYDLLTHEEQISRDLIHEYAKRHMVCPFEMCLDITLFADAVICDYNYLFDPHVALKRFFAQEKSSDYAFLIDEAHNLVDRAREMYSADLYKEDFLHIRTLLKSLDNRLAKTIIKRLSACNKDLLEYKKNCDDFTVLPDIDSLIMHLLRLAGDLEDLLQEDTVFEERTEVLEFYFAVRSFLYIHELLDEKYTIYTDYTDDGRFRIRLQCMDPSGNLAACLAKGRSAIYFSATLLPIKYYKEQLAGDSEDYAIYAPSPFCVDNRLLMVAGDVSTKYTRRNEKEYAKIAGYIQAFTSARTGNYLVFFPSYQMIRQVMPYLDTSGITLLTQEPSMDEHAREEFLDSFSHETKHTQIGLCVMGGVFGEGIDLKDDRLIGAVIVGTGLPMVCNEREHFHRYYDAKNGCGFAYAYLYPGINKVLQSAGRVIRTDSDRGAILLLDERFLQSSYQELFPREWFPHEVVTLDGMKKLLQQFWSATPPP